MVATAFSLLLANTAAFSHGDLISSINAVTEQIELDNADPDLYFKRAELYRRHLDWSSAASDYDSAKKLGFDPTELLFYRGRMHFEAGQYTLAESLLDAHLALVPNSAKGLLVRADIPTRNPLVAVEDIDQALKLVKTPTPDMFLDRAKLTVKAGPEHFDRMISGIQEGIDTLGPIVSLIAFGVTQCVQNQQHQMGVALIANLPEKVRKQANWQARLGNLHVASNDPITARVHYLAALGAIEALPLSRRNTQAMLKLEDQLRTALAGIE